MDFRPVPSHLRPVRLAAGVALLALGATACGQTAVTPPALPVSESPIATFFGMSLNEDDQQDMYLAAERGRIDWVTTCMAQEGFEYRASDPSELLGASSSDPDAPPWGSDEWVATYGFGISTQVFDQAMIGPELVGALTSTYEYVDPNETYMQSLTNDEQSAFWAALYGTDSYEWDSTMTDEENHSAADSYFANRVTTGCEPLSYETFMVDDPYSRMYETFGDELSSMYERVGSAPEITTAMVEISRCAAAAGFGFTDEEVLSNEINRRLEPVYNGIVWPTSDFSEEAWAELSDEQLQELENQSPTLTAEAKAILAEVQQYEVEMAATVYGCGYGDMQALYRHVMNRYEQEFVDSHRGQLELLRTS